MSVIFLDNDLQEWSECLKELESIDITHAVITYRTKEGDLKYKLFGHDHTTFLIGMIDRVKMHINTNS
jgi:hypothetical protein